METIQIICIVFGIITCLITNDMILLRLNHILFMIAFIIEVIMAYKLKKLK